MAPFDAYLSKPVTLSSVVSALNHVCRPRTQGMSRSLSFISGARSHTRGGGRRLSKGHRFSRGGGPRRRQCSDECGRQTGGVPCGAARVHCRVGDRPQCGVSSCHGETRRPPRPTSRRWVREVRSADKDNIVTLGRLLSGEVTRLDATETQFTAPVGALLSPSIATRDLGSHLISTAASTVAYCPFLADNGGVARALVVEDNKLNQLLLTRFLKSGGAEVTTADNGRDGLDMFTRFPQGHFRIIL